MDKIDPPSAGRRRRRSRTSRHVDVGAGSRAQPTLLPGSGRKAYPAGHRDLWRLLTTPPTGTGPRRTRAPAWRRRRFAMRRIVAFTLVSAAVGAAAGGALVVWRRNPRVGSGFVNSVVNPALVRRGLVGRRRVRTRHARARRPQVRHPTVDARPPGADVRRLSHHGAARSALRMGPQRRWPLATAASSCTTSSTTSTSPR